MDVEAGTPDVESVGVLRFKKSRNMDHYYGDGFWNWAIDLWQNLEDSLRQDVENEDFPPDFVMPKLAKRVLLRF